MSGPSSKVAPSNGEGAHESVESVQSADSVKSSSSVFESVFPESKQSVLSMSASQTSATSGEIDRISSILSRMSLANILVPEFKFEDRRWLLFPFTGSLLVAILCGILAVCQGLEARPQGILMRDAAEAANFIWNPSTYLPCFDGWQSACWPQYAATGFFVLIACIALLEAFIVYQTWVTFDAHTGRAGENQTRGSFLLNTISRVTPVGTFLAPGERFFWHRAWVVFVTEITLQIIRGFLLFDAYARVSAAQTLVQTMLIVLHVDVFLYIFYYRSEVGYVFNGFYFEISYLIVRVSLFGPLSLRTTGVWDFLTIAVPLLFTLSDLHEILHFIKHSNAEKETNVVAFHVKAYHGIVLWGTAFVITLAGVLLCVTIIRTGFMDECPAVYDVAERPEDFIMPAGVDCYSWKYNLFLHPACSCIFLAIKPFQSEVCAGMNKNNHSAIKHLIPHLQDVRFLTVEAGFVEGCRPTADDLDLFASFINLQRLAIFEFDVDAIPDSFKNFWDLRDLDIFRSYLKEIDPNILAAWPRLERFTCSECPKLEAIDVLGEVSLPRLSEVEVHGVHSCPGWMDFPNNFVCSEKSAAPSCAGIPEWLLQSYLSGLRKASNRNTCVESLCLAKWNRFKYDDLDGNFFVDASEGSTTFVYDIRMHNEPVTDFISDTHRCVVSKLRNELIAGGFIEVFGDMMVLDYTSHSEYLAYNTQYTTCFDCPFSQQAMIDRAQIYNESQNIDYSDPCWMINHFSPRPVEDFRRACMNTETQCFPSSCPIGFQFIAALDQDLDLKFSEAEVANAVEKSAVKWAQPGLFQCFEQRAPECVDTRYDNGSLAMSLQAMMKVGFGIYEFALTDCSECEEFPAVGELKTQLWELHIYPLKMIPHIEPSEGPPKDMIEMARSPSPSGNGPSSPRSPRTGYRHYKIYIQCTGPGSISPRGPVSVSSLPRGPVSVSSLTTGQRGQVSVSTISGGTTRSSLSVEQGRTTRSSLSVLDAFNQAHLIKKGSGRGSLTSIGESHSNRFSFISSSSMNSIVPMDYPRNSQAGQRNSFDARDSRYPQNWMTRLSTMVLMDFQFEDQKWLLFPGTGCVLIAALCAALVICQGLEAKPQGILMRHAENAANLIWNPETYMPCFEQWEDSCWPQYLTCIFFGFAGCIAVMEVYFVWLSWQSFQNKSERARSLEETSWGSVLVNTLSKFTPVNTRFAPGEKYFWIRAWILFLIQIVLQVIRGFVLEDSYARVSAPQTLAQIILITAQADMFLYMYSQGSEVGYIFSDLYFMIAYILVRVSLFGPFSLRTTSGLDFLTVAGPLLITLSNLHEVLHFITHGINGDQKSKKLQYVRKINNGPLIALVLFITGFGFYLSSVIVRTGFLEECPAVYNDAVRPQNFLVPDGLDCHSWQYNLFLHPACSCLYLAMNPYQSAECAGLGVNKQQALVGLMPHLEDLRFLYIGTGFTDTCRATAEDMKWISGFKHLRWFNIHEWRVETIPDSFKEFTDLRHFEINQGMISEIDTDVLNAWPRLETFSCIRCPHMKNIAAFREATLPRLGTIEVHGVETCPEWVGFPETYICTALQASDDCPGMSQWLLESIKNGVRGGRTRNVCSLSLCSMAWDHYTRFADSDSNYLMDAAEGNTYNDARLMATDLPPTNYTAETHQCFVNITRNELSQAYSEDYDGLDLTNYLTHIEFSSFFSRFTTCADCEFLENVTANRKRIFEESANIDRSDPCWMIKAYSDKSVSTFRAACKNPETSCIPSSCPISFQYMVNIDEDLDLKFSEEDLHKAGQMLSVKWPQEAGVFECLKQQAPECIDTSLDDGRDATSLNMIFKMGLEIFGMQVSDCSTCPDFPQVGQYTEFHTHQLP